jgi:hypothetical protein
LNSTKEEEWRVTPLREFSFRFEIFHERPFLMQIPEEFVH